MEVEFKAMLDDLDVLEKSLSDPAPIHKVCLKFCFRSRFLSGLLFVGISLDSKRTELSHALCVLKSDPCIDLTLDSIKKLSSLCEFAKCQSFWLLHCCSCDHMLRI